MMEKGDVGSLGATYRKIETVCTVHAVEGGFAKSATVQNQMPGKDFAESMVEGNN